MKYVALIYADADGWEALPEDERQKISERYMALAGEPASVGGEQLEDADTATTVRVRDGETLTTDGPFAETKEQLGGYYLIEAKDADEAIAVAARIPGAQYGSIEVRPVFSAADYEG